VNSASSLRHATQTQIVVNIDLTDLTIHLFCQIEDKIMPLGVNFGEAMGMIVKDDSER